MAAELKITLSSGPNGPIPRQETADIAFMSSEMGSCSVPKDTLK